MSNDPRDSANDPAPLGTPNTTSRGFPLLEFVDFYGKKCSLQCSSIVLDDDGMDSPGTSCVWLGIDDATPQVLAREAAAAGLHTDETSGWVDYPLPASVHLFTRMHLDRDQVRGLIDRLEEWYEHGAWGEQPQ